MPLNFLLGVISTVTVAWFFLRVSAVHSTVVVRGSPLGSSVVWLIVLSPLLKSTTVSSLPLRTTLLLLPVVVPMNVSSSGQLLFTSSLLPIWWVIVASIVFRLMSLKNLGREGGGSKKHLRSVGLSFLSVPARASVHSVLRLGGVQQHL